MRGRTLRSRIYDGSLYALLLDPWLTPLHRIVAGYIPADSNVLDVGCGTGNLSVIMAEKAARVVGIELSPAMADYARRRVASEQRSNVTIETADAAMFLADRPTGSFDVATMVLALHEMPADARKPLLREAARVARRLIVVDFRIPLPRNWAGFRNRMAEIAAGAEHYRAFRDFDRRGGTSHIAASAGLRCRRRHVLDGDSLEICEVRRDPASGRDQRHPSHG